MLSVSFIGMILILAVVIYILVRVGKSKPKSTLSQINADTVENIKTTVSKREINTNINSHRAETIDQLADIKVENAYKFCIKCGYKNISEDNFCVNCGTKFSE